MSAQRINQLLLRRLAASQPTILSQQLAMKTIAGSSLQQQTRPVATQKVTPNDSLSILAEQRKKRPTAPHLTIYKWQITSVASIMTRMTGGALAGGFYIFGSAYLLSPLLGWHLDSASIAAAFGALPLAAKVLAKFAVAMPFTFHSFNGVRHLAWDLGLGFKNKEVIRTGLFMTGVSVVSALGLALLL